MAGVSCSKAARGFSWVRSGEMASLRITEEGSGALLAYLSLLSVAMELLTDIV